MGEWIASLPMYDFPFLRDATDEWWRGIARHFREAGIEGVPDRLTRPGEGAEHWLRDDLLFSQTCGYPLTTALAGKVTPVGTPCYDFDECDGPFYCSVVLVRRDGVIRKPADLAGAALAINMASSWSGHHALRLLPGAGGGLVLESGSHRASMETVAAGQAEAAAIDCVSFGLIARHESSLVSELHTLCHTPLSPGLPYIAGQLVSPQDARRMRDALESAVADPTLQYARSALGIGDVAYLGTERYAQLAAMLKTAGPPLL